MRLFKRNLSRLVVAGIGIVAILIGFLVPATESDHGFAWTRFNGFFALLGFIGCIGIIYLAKWLGHYWLQRKDDYYD